MQNNTNKVIFYLILVVCIIVPFGNDVFISGLPAINHYFMTDKAPLVVGVFLLGLAIAQPFYGPLSDRFGRRPVLLTGLWIYTIASLLIVFSKTFPLLLLFRFIQSIGACSVIISVLAIVRDSYHKEKIIGATSLIMTIIGVCPAIAPLLGSVLNTLWGWRASFVYLLVLGCFFTLLIQFFFKETQEEKNHHALNFKKLFTNYWSLIRQPRFLSYCMTSGFSYGVLFSYFSMSALFIIIQMHFSLISYGLLLASNAIAIVATALFIPKLAKRIPIHFIMQIGLFTIISGGLLMWLVNLILSPSIYSFMLPMFLTTIGIGMIRPTASAGAMHLADKSVAGSAAAFFSFLSFLGGALAVTFSTNFIHSVAIFGLFIIFMGIIAMIMNLILTQLNVKQSLKRKVCS